MSVLQDFLVLILNPVKLNLRVQRRGFDAQQPRGPGLMPAGLIERQSDQTRLKSFNLAIEIDAFGNVQGTYAVGFIRKRLIASKRCCLSEQRVREVKQTLYAVSSRPFSHF
jgi:hypothetical protein